MPRGEELEAVERELKEALKQQEACTEDKQREAWAKQLKESRDAEQQKRDVWVAKKEAEPIHSQVSKKRTPAAKGHDGKEPPTKREKKDKEPPTTKKCARDHKHKWARRAMETRNNQLKVKRSTRPMGKTRLQKQRATRRTIMPSKTRKRRRARMKRRPGVKSELGPFSH